MCVSTLARTTGATKTLKIDLPVIAFSCNQSSVRLCICPIDSGRTECALVVVLVILGTWCDFCEKREPTCESEVMDSECRQLWEALDDELHVRVLQLVAADIELLQGFELRHGPGEG